MSEEQLKELQEYNLEYLEAQSSEEIFGGDYTSAVELKYAKKEIERLNKERENDIKYNKYLQKELAKSNNIIKEVREWTKKCSCQFTNDDGELVVSEISFNIQARPCDLFKILDKER